MHTTLLINVKSLSHAQHHQHHSLICSSTQALQPTHTHTHKKKNKTTTTHFLLRSSRWKPMSHGAAAAARVLTSLLTHWGRGELPVDTNNEVQSTTKVHYSLLVLPLHATFLMMHECETVDTCRVPQLNWYYGIKLYFTIEVGRGLTFRIYLNPSSH